MASPPHRRALDWATIALFVGALLAPAVDQLVRADAARDTQSAERRRPAPRPGLPRTLAELTRFPRRYEDHYSDTFGLRDLLLGWNARERWFGLGLSPSKLIEPAADGWCFLADQSRDAFRGLQPFTAEDLEGWVRRLRERHDYLAARGIRYLFVLCPNKATIYPERVPASWNVLGPTRLEQLAARLEHEPDAPFLDLRPALLAAKAGDQPEDWVYTRFGTHWNGRGGQAAYRALVARLQRDFPALVAVPAEDCRAVEAEGDTDSLARQLYLAGHVRQRQYGLKPAERGYEVAHASTYTEGAVLVTHKDIDAPRLLWLHDSFGPFLEGLVCESFSFVEARWTHEFPVEAVFSARPDLVLETYVERRLIEEEPYRPIDTRVRAPEVEFEELSEHAWRTDERFTGVQPFGEARLEPAGEGLRMSLPDARAGVRLPALELPPGSQALLRIAAACPASTEVDVFVRPAGARSFLRKDHARAELGPDTGVAVVRLPAVGARFETVLRFRTTSPSLVLRSLEVRHGPRAGR